MVVLPTRQEVIEITKELIAGKRDPMQVGLWAAQLDLPENKERDDQLRMNDPLLRDFLDDLSLAAEKNDSDKMLYDAKDFQEWLDEFIQNIESEKKL